MTHKELIYLCNKFLGTLDKFSITHEDIDKIDDTKVFVYTYKLVEYWARQGVVNESDLRKFT